MIATVTTLISRSDRLREEAPHKSLFNVCLFIATIMAAGLVFGLAGVSATPDLRELVLPMAACGITYFLIDTFGVSFIVALSQKIERVEGLAAHLPVDYASRTLLDSFLLVP